MAAVSELDQAEARVSALLTAHADGELWDVKTLVMWLLILSVDVRLSPKSGRST